MNLSIFALIAALAIPSDDDPDAARAAALLEAGEAQQAAELWRDVLSRRRAELPADDPKVGEAFNNLAYALSRADQHDDALAVGRSALKWAQGIGDPSDATAFLRKSLSQMAARAGRMEQALDYAEAAVFDAEHLYGHTPLVGQAHEQAARAATQLGQLERALDHWRQSLAITERYFGKSDPGALAKPLHEIALLLEVDGRSDAAETLRGHALALLSETPQRPESYQHRQGMIQLLEPRGEQKEAARHLRAFVETARAANAPDLATSNAWASRWIALGDPGEALALLDQQVLDPADPDAIWAQSWRALALMELAEPQRALAEADRGLEWESDREEPTGLFGELMGTRARALLALGEVEAASKVLYQLWQVQRQAYGVDRGALLSLALSTLRAEREGEARRAEQIDLLEIIDACRQNLLPGQLASQRVAASQQAGWRSWVDAEAQLAAEPERFEAGLRRLDARHDREALTATSAWWERAGARRTPGVAEYLSVLRRDAAGEFPEGRREEFRALRDAARRALRAESPALARVLCPEPLDVARLRSKLGARERFVSLHRGAASAWALVVGPEASQDQVVDLGSSVALERAARLALQRLHDADSAADLAELSSRLRAPLDEVLDGVEGLTLAADGVLAFVPYAALVDEAGRPWIQDRVLRRARSARSFSEAEDAVAGEDELRIAAGAARRWLPQVLRRLHARFPVRPGTTPRPELARVGAENDSVLRGEAAWSQQAHGDRRWRSLWVEAPVYVDTAVPAASTLDLGEPGPAGKAALWDRPDGVLGLGALLDAPIAARAVVFTGASTNLPSVADPDSAGLHALVAGLQRGGASNVLVSGWNAVPGRSSAFEQLLREEMLRADPTEALTRAQRRWLDREGAPKDPALWARHLAFVGGL